MILWTTLSLLAIVVATVLVWPRGQQKKLSGIVTVAILLFIPGFSLLWYHHFGASEKLAELQSIQHQILEAKNEMHNFGTPKKMVAKLEAHMSEHPHDAKGWYLLGKIYLDTGYYKNAEARFNTAHTLKPNDNSYKVALAQAMFLSHHRKLPKHAKQLLTEVIAEQPDNSNALNLLAVNDYLAGHYQQAIKRWKLLLPAYAADSEDGKALRAMIKKATLSIN